MSSPAWLRPTIDWRLPPKGTARRISSAGSLTLSYRATGGQLARTGFYQKWIASGMRFNLCYVLIDVHFGDS
jgi:hypothetical protein